MDEYRNDPPCSTLKQREITPAEQEFRLASWREQLDMFLGQREYIAILEQESAIQAESLERMQRYITALESTNRELLIQVQQSTRRGW